VYSSGFGEFYIDIRWRQHFQALSGPERKRVRVHARNKGPLDLLLLAIRQWPG